MDDAIFASGLVTSFAVFFVLPLLVTYDICNARNKGKAVLILPFLFSWFGVVVVWLLMRPQGETQYPFQKIF